MLILYTITIFVSACLLFLVQPMFARMVLPMLGGSPAVWNTALVFYQATLLAGYAYAHALTTRCGIRQQVGLHLLVLAAPLFLLPIVLPAGWTPPSTADPILWLLLLLLVAVGAPFFAVSTTSPILQKWFAATGHRSAADPYFLYAASNAGSLLALVAYPLIVEPRLRLLEQSLWWRNIYVLFVALMAGCTLVLWCNPGSKGAQEVTEKSAIADDVREAAAKETAVEDAITWHRRGRWVLWSMVPSSLMIGFTTYLSSEIASFPLLWVVPLIIYLLTFILVFASRPPLSHKDVVRSFPILVLPLVIAITVRATEPLILLLPLHLLVFFLATMMCHGELARDRPAARHLTEFYLWMSFGGMLGGFFNALVAPQIFSGVTEYPLMLVLACVLMPSALPVIHPRPTHEPVPVHWHDVLLPVMLGLVTVALVASLQHAGLSGPPALALMFGPTSLVCFAFSRRPLRFALALAAVLWSGRFYHLQLEGDLLLTERSFFGVHRVTLDDTGRYVQLVHGNTLHGMQSRDPARRDEALSYYYRTGPIGQVFEAIGPRARRIAVVGLGVGSLTVYGKPGQQWMYYEIDPVVERIARDTRYFTFLHDCRTNLRVTLGDARLSLQREANGVFDLIVLDAYSSDAIPVHLMTREALHLYIAKLAPHGILAFHISNRHLDLEPVLDNLVRDAGLACRIRTDTDVSDTELKLGKMQSQWAIAARRPADLGPILQDARWQSLRRDAGSQVWTDDYSSILDALQWQ